MSILFELIVRPADQKRLLFWANFWPRRTMVRLLFAAAACALASSLQPPPAFCRLGQRRALAARLEERRGPWLTDGSDFSLPGLLLAGGPVAAAVLWTGLVTTALVRCGENAALAQVPIADATILVASEPLWAALWAALLFDAAPSANQVAGGALVVAASCLVAAKTPRDP